MNSVLVVIFENLAATGPLGMVCLALLILFIWTFAVVLYTGAVLGRVARRSREAIENVNDEVAQELLDSTRFQAAMFLIEFILLLGWVKMVRAEERALRARSWHAGPQEFAIEIPPHIFRSPAELDWVDATTKDLQLRRPDSKVVARWIDESKTELRITMQRLRACGRR